MGEAGVAVANMSQGRTALRYARPGAENASSHYDSAPLRETLLELVDFFSPINARAVRLGVGAVNVLDGDFVYFDNIRDEIAPEHVMASGALPPALPMVKTGTDHFGDGGIVCKTPLQHLFDQHDNLNSLVFHVDLFSARRALPRDIHEVMACHKDILRLQHELSDLPEVAMLQLIYQQKSYEGHAKDYEFSGASKCEHWQIGYDDTMWTLNHRIWIAMPPPGQGVVVHDVHREDDL